MTTPDVVSLAWITCAALGIVVALLGAWQVVRSLLRLMCMAGPLAGLALLLRHAPWHHDDATIAKLSKTAILSTSPSVTTRR